MLNRETTKLTKNNEVAANKYCVEYAETGVMQNVTECYRMVNTYYSKRYGSTS